LCALGEARSVFAHLSATASPGVAADAPTPLLVAVAPTDGAK
jgi:hypothetical protein